MKAYLRFLDGETSHSWMCRTDDNMPYSHIVLRSWMRRTDDSP
jgi:hypothetical protein